MQLLKIVLYRVDGSHRELSFNPGELNIVTGKSRTGKSVLLSIVDYCLGRDKVEMPPGPIRKHVSWFGTLWQFSDGARVFLGRPAMPPGQQETNKMMVVLGSQELDVPEFSELQVNTDSNTARSQVGSRIGLVDAKVAAAASSLKADASISLGAAVLFCLQEQHEVANKSMLFHRQNSQGILTTLRDTLPYFLGALPGDNAAKHAQLREVKRALRALRKEEREAVEDVSQASERLTSLLAEAHEAGLVDVAWVPDVGTAIELLNNVRSDQPGPLVPSSDIQSQDRRRELEEERSALRFELGQLLDDRALLLDFAQGRGGFGHAVGQHIQRLSSLNLLQQKTGSDTESRETCPVCRQELEGEDPLPIQLTQRLSSLNEELESIARTEPKRRAALDDIDLRAKQSRTRLIALDLALREIEGLDAESGARTGTDRREFIRGRVDATLDQYRASDEDKISALQAKIEALEFRVKSLDLELDDDLAEQKLRSVVSKLSDRITEIAVELEVENAKGGVWLDVEKLTVILDTDTGPATLSSLGSGANWLGIHLAVHLALHELFVRENRPVPRLLMLDQPTQVFYESRQYVGEDEVTADEDHDAVAKMFRLMFDVAKKHAPELQIIVSDHANLNEEWFAQSVRYNWRGNDALIPASWME